MLSSIVVEGIEHLNGEAVLSAMRAPTDNDARMLPKWTFQDIWQGENLDRAFNKVYNCEIIDGRIAVHGSFAGISRMPVCQYCLWVDIFENGKIDFALDAQIREDAKWLPRFGYEFQLSGDIKEFTYFGKGPGENYCDLSHCAPLGLYSSDTEKEYVEYVRPQEHGNHAGARMLKIGKITFTSDNDFEFNVSDYSTDSVYKAQHTDELVKDGKTHLRIDYKVSGIGSASCGPDIQSKYRLSDKRINFAFSIEI